MAIPNHVKKQAMDAINDKVTTAQIRAFAGNGADVPQDTPFRYSDALRPQVHPIPDAVRRQAMDAINHHGTRAQILSMEHCGDTPARALHAPVRNPLAEKINRMHRMGHGVDSVHQEMTKDGFGREYDR